jgi:hypothetical protein
MSKRWTKRIPRCTVLWLVRKRTPAEAPSPQPAPEPVVHVHNGTPPKSGDQL